MNRKIAVSFIALTSVFMSAWAVTEKEMEQAKVIAAQAYLRYANDGSGYLDEIKVSTMAELESKLKKTEKENLVAFKAAANPTGYSEWDKEQLVKYWGDTFFRSSALTEKGKMAKSRVKKRVGAMTIAAPSQDVAPEKSQPVEETPQDPVQEETGGDEKTTPAVPEEMTAAANSIDSVATALEEIQDDFEQKRTERNNSTWVYVLILAVLVGIVVWLVVFASKMIKKSNAAVADNSDKEDRGEEMVSADLRARASAAQSEIARLRGEIDRLTTEKDTEIATLRSRCEQSAFEASRLRAELTDARSRLAAVQAHSTPVAPSSMPPVAERYAESIENPMAKVEKKATEEQTSPSGVKTIYLGRVNAAGLFVRADRGVVMGHTVYRLDTTDGFSGTFRVVNNLQVWGLLLQNPREMLSGGCQAEDLLDTTGYNKIVTESSGTAIFENGCWRVLRRCVVRYE